MLYYVWTFGVIFIISDNAFKKSLQRKMNKV